ncbi:polysaccharide biosynthesis/export family protein [Pyruvatibacter sp. HU-CL02332]|uniref:polysaccharide biosynthesis/export family protein n=1 Tax=Pyruvatibacter sp. HU-CL02332 TaxID=3127650 RepID=UPI0031089F87
MVFRTVLKALQGFLGTLLLAGMFAASMASTAASQSDADARELVYKLGTGDRVRVIVFNEEDLSGEFEVDSTGSLALPLIGNISARGLTLREFETSVADALRDGYLKDPRVNVEVLNFRPFYIIGEVENGGEYDFVPEMTVLNAVALAGGYTYRADDRRVFVTKAGTNTEVEHRMESAIKVLPGDIIRVPERFF